MNAFIALEKYIVKEELPFGVGVPVTLNESVAQYDSTRKKGVLSYNNWMFINIPDESFFLDMNKPVKEQSDEVFNALMRKDFIMSLFIYESKKLFQDMNNFPPERNTKDEYNRLMEELVKEKYDLLLKFNSGLELFNFVNSKCVTHDKGKSSSLLYDFGIKGSLYNDQTGKRLLVFNAKKDIEPVMYRSGILEDSRLVL